jgi:hypothetical protein
MVDMCATRTRNILSYIQCYINTLQHIRNFNVHLCTNHQLMQRSIINIWKNILAHHLWMQKSMHQPNIPIHAIFGGYKHHDKHFFKPYTTITKILLGRVVGIWILINIYICFPNSIDDNTNKRSNNLHW